MNTIQMWFASFKKNDRGSFTMEASLLFPIILVITICLILFSLVVFEKVVLQQRAHLIAEHLAFVWDNSNKDIMTGEFPRNQYTTSKDVEDGLYWRIRDDLFLSRFNIISNPSNVELSIGEKGTSLPAKKLSRITTDVLPNGVTGTVKYQNDILGRKIIVELERPLNLPKFVTDLFQTNIVTAKATAIVTDPVEFIRTTDMIITYLEKLDAYFGKITKFIDP